MLGGLHPILIFNFPIALKNPLTAASEGVPTAERTWIDKIGIPIPIYLDPNLTGIHVDSETKALDIESDPYTSQDGKTTVVIQKALNNTVTVNLIAKRDSIILAALLSMSDLVFTKVISQEYGVTYLNGPTTVFNGLLDSFTAHPGDNDDLMRITIVLSKARQTGTLIPTGFSSIAKTSGATLAGGN